MPDPNDLREAVKLLRTRPPSWSGGVEQVRVDLADRLEAWADDLEHTRANTDCPKLGWIWRSPSRPRGGWEFRTLLEDRTFPADAEFIAMRSVGDVLSHHQAVAARSDMERPAPLEAAVLDAAKAMAESVSSLLWLFGGQAAPQERVNALSRLSAAKATYEAAVRALQEATDA